MLEKDYRDIVAGALLAALGVAISLYALSHYSIGTITRMGPGMVPVGLGVLLAIFGVVIGGTAWFREGNWPKVKVATPLLVLVSILIFAISIERLGLVPAVFLSVLAATLAELKIYPVRSLILAVALCLLAYLVFLLGLRLPIPAFAWRF